MAPACNRSSGEGRDSGRGRFAGIPIGGNGRGDGAEEDGRILGGCGGCTSAGGGAAAPAEATGTGGGEHCHRFMMVVEGKSGDFSAKVRES